MTAEGWAICLGPSLLVAAVAASIARRGPKAAGGVSLAGIMATWVWPLLVSVAGAGHCPQGDPETWTISHVLCLGVFMIAAPLLAVTPRQPRWRWVVPLVVLVPLILRAPELIEIAGGRHLCGAERGAPDYTEWYATAYVPAMVTYSVVLSAVALVPYFRASDHSAA